MKKTVRLGKPHLTGALFFAGLKNKDTAPDLDADGVMLLCFFGGSEQALSSY